MDDRKSHFVVFSLSAISFACIVLIIMSVAGAFRPSDRDADLNAYST